MASQPSRTFGDHPRDRDVDREHGGAPLPGTRASFGTQHGTGTSPVPRGRAAAAMAHPAEVHLRRITCSIVTWTVSTVPPRPPGTRASLGTQQGTVTAPVPAGTRGCFVASQPRRTFDELLDRDLDREHGASPLPGDAAASARNRGR